MPVTSTVGGVIGMGADAWEGCDTGSAAKACALGTVPKASASVFTSPPAIGVAVPGCTAAPGVTVALAHEYFSVRGGAERVVEVFLGDGDAS